MTNKEIENRIKKSFENQVPDVFENILSECEQSQKITAQNPQKGKLKINFKKIIAVAAAVVTVMVSGMAGFFLAKIDKVDSVISLDVNPGIEFKINKNEKIISAYGVNDDGKKVIGNMDLSGSNLSVAINAIIGSMLRNGYIDELSNSILITVYNSDEERSDELEKFLSDEINAIFKDENFDAEVISQTLNKSKEIAKLAKEYGITAGKAQLIKQIIDQNKKYEFKDLAPLTIKQLNSILSGEQVETTSSDNVAAEKNILSKKKAKKKALSHAGISEDDAVDYSISLDVEKGKMFYKILFRTDVKEYKYKINAQNGKIVDSSVIEAYIGKQAAEKVALECAGVTENDITGYECTFANEIYYIKFYIGPVMYEIQVTGTSSEVIYSNPKIPKNLQVELPVISEVQAKEVLLNNGCDLSEIWDYSCAFTKNGKIPVYEIRFKNYADNKEKILEYLYVINATNGDEIGKDVTEFADSNEHNTYSSAQIESFE